MLTPYEINPKKINFILFWLLIGTAVFLLQEMLLFAWKENGFFIFRFIFTYLLYTLVPISVITLSYKAKKMIVQSNAIFKIDIEDPIHKNGIDVKITRIISYKTNFAKFAGLAVCIAFDIIILTTPGFRFTSATLSWLIFALFQIGGIMGGHATYLILVLLNLLTQYRKYTIRAPFLMSSNIVISPITNFYYTASTVALLLYSLHDIALTQTPFIQTKLGVLWLILGSFFPLAMFLWIFFASHLLMQNVKHYNIKIINDQIQSEYEKLKDTHNIDILKGLIEIQNMVENSKTWSFGIEGVFTFVTSVALPISQIVLSQMGYFN